MNWYTLENKVPVKIAGYPNFEEKDKRVDLTEIGDIRISTVFLGLDHNWGEGPPLLFETMIFGGEHNEYQERCSTWTEAEAMHDKAVRMVKGSKG